jgi:hypothetical protein
MRTSVSDKTLILLYKGRISSNHWKTMEALKPRDSTTVAGQ